MLTGKQRSYLKSLAHNIEPVVYIGKSDLTDAVKKEIDECLEDHELVKVQIQNGSVLDPKKTCSQLADELSAEFVQAIGHRFVLYRQAKKKDKRKIIIPR